MLSSKNQRTKKSVFMSTRTPSGRSFVRQSLQLEAGTTKIKRPVDQISHCKHREDEPTIESSLFRSDHLCGLTRCSFIKCLEAQFAKCCEKSCGHHKQNPYATRGSITTLEWRFTLTILKSIWTSFTLHCLDS